MQTKREAEIHAKARYSVTRICLESPACILLPRFFLANGGTQSNEWENVKIKVIHDK